MKKIFFSTYVLLALVACNGSGASNTNSSSSSSTKSEACSDMRSYDAGLEYGSNDKRGAEAVGNALSSCDGVLQNVVPTNESYDHECFCKGFYKGQSK